jgi:hypothetical protein
MVIEMREAGVEAWEGVKTQGRRRSTAMMIAGMSVADVILLYT